MVLIKKRFGAIDYVALGRLAGHKGIKIAFEYIGLEIWINDSYALFRLIDKRGGRSDNMQAQKVIVSPSSRGGAYIYLKGVIPMMLYISPDDYREGDLMEMLSLETVELMERR